MKIVRIEPKPVSVPLTRTDPPQLWGPEWSVQMPLILHTDTELKGVGDVFISAADQSSYAGYAETFSKLLRDTDPTEINKIHIILEKASFTAGRGGVVSAVLSGIDIALHDLNAKKLGVPVYELLGGKVRDKLELYASYARYSNAEDVYRVTQKCLESGFKAIKLHQPPSNVLDSVKKVRELGYDFKLMIDLNCTMTLTGAIRLLQKLERFELEWVEEPIWPPENHGALGELSSYTGIPIAAGENEYTLAGFESLAKTGKVKILQPDIAKVGGFTTMRKIAAIAECLGPILIPHCRPQSLWITILATAHLASTLPWEPLLEVSPTPPEQSPFLEPLRIEKGFLYLPGNNGLGVKSDGWFDSFPPVVARPPRFHD
jgi:L-alanine-DL-glutamate epimerase-like enolase superfamily enzyme